MNKGELTRAHTGHGIAKQWEDKISKDQAISSIFVSSSAEPHTASFLYIQNVGGGLFSCILGQHKCGDKDSRCV